MIGICRLKNEIQEYSWGSTTFIPELLASETPRRSHGRNTPYAELWMGAHPRAPSRVSIGDREVPLPDLLQEDPTAILGESSARRFQGRLPFLFKVIAAAQPISIQAHPDSAQARDGYARENSRGIAPDAADRNFRDENHKPEIFCALTHARVLRGFRSISDIRSRMGIIDIPALNRILDCLDPDSEHESLRTFFLELMGIDGETRARVVKTAVMRSPSDEPEWMWVRTLARAYPEDIGALAPLFLNLISLKPREAVFVQAGELHAYLDGAGIELMANSDNVLRGGLTHKHVDVAELVKVVRFESRRAALVEILSSSGDCSGSTNEEQTYLTPAEEFRLSEILLANTGTYCVPSARQVELLLCVAGSGTIEEQETGHSHTFARGTSFLIPASVGSYRIRGEGRVYKATVPPERP